MQSRYRDAEAEDFVRRYAAAGRDLALRVYTSRLIGQEPDLVLHGGGNTSVKTTQRDALGVELRVLCVKGSGADLAAVEPPGLPALELEPLLALRGRERLDDRTMVNELRRRLLDSSAPNPSVEALLHAFLPHAFVDHTHADAILLLTNQPDGEQLVRRALGDEVAVLPWIMPGFPLAKAVAAAHERQPDCLGVVLRHHGLFTFGPDARRSYELTIELVDRAERFAKGRIAAVPAAPGMVALDPAARRRLLRAALPMLRGAVAMRVGPDAHWVRAVAEVRSSDEVAAFGSRADAGALCATGPITPDHVIRTKGRYLFLGREEAGDRAAIDRAVAAYVGWYRDYFEGCARPRGAAAMLAPMPVVVVIEGCGLVALQPQRRAARIAADIAEHTLRVWARGAALGRYVPLSGPELAEMEYWPLELQKLGRSQPPLLGGQVALVTGAGGAIGCGIAEALLREGACVLATDVDPERLQRAAARLAGAGGSLATAVADLTDTHQVEGLFDDCVLAFGGVDVVVPNAGVAHAGRLEDMDRARFEQVMAVNATATMSVLQAAAGVLRAQGTGGSIVLQASKNVFAPGAGFGAYSASKAAALQLGRIAALEFAEFGVRVNMINADAVFGDDEVPSQLWAEVGPERMRARGLDPAGLRAYYRDRSLLKVAVTPAHVGEAVVFFASQRTPTTGAVLPVDGGLPEAFPR